MIREDELNRQRAEKLSKLILEHPGMPVIAWINSEDISDDYHYWAGNIGEPSIETITLSNDKYEPHYISKEDDAYDDCYNYYGCECDDWSDEELEEKAKAIPWEDVITIRVSAV